LSHGEAEDVLQDTFLTLLRLPARPENPAHYCMRTLRNRALNYRRSLWRRLSREWESNRWFDRQAEESPTETAAMQALAELPLDQREVIVLKLWNRCTFEEIGGLLEISPNTAAGRYRYGLQKIKNQLKDVYETERLEQEPSGEPIALLAAAAPLAPG
jgi:RNA polymerase sigma-70 factor (ECF subfamily)